MFVSFFICVVYQEILVFRKLPLCRQQILASYFHGIRLRKNLVLIIYERKYTYEKDNSAIPILLIILLLLLLYFYHHFGINLKGMAEGGRNGHLGIRQFSKKGFIFAIFSSKKSNCKLPRKITKARIVKEDQLFIYCLKFDV